MLIHAAVIFNPHCCICNPYFCHSLILLGDDRAEDSLRLLCAIVRSHCSLAEGAHKPGEIKILLSKGTHTHTRLKCSTCNVRFSDTNNARHQMGQHIQAKKDAVLAQHNRNLDQIAASTSLVWHRRGRTSCDARCTSCSSPVYWTQRHEPCSRHQSNRRLIV